MEPAIVAVCVLVWAVMAGSAVSGRWRGRARVADWESAARTCRLDGVATTYDGRQRRLEARRGALKVSLSSFVLFGSGTKAKLDGLAPWLELRVRPEAGRLDVDRGRTVADAAFDALFHVRGRRVGVQALFGHDVRRLLFEVFAGESRGADLVALGQGRLVAQIDDGDPATRAARLAGVLESLLAIAEGLRRTEGLEILVAENARVDPQPTVRLRCLEVLLEECPDHPATAVAVRAALADSDDRVHRAAAFASPEEGRAILLDLVRDDTTDDAVASRALPLVAGAIDGDELERILAIALGAGKEATVVASLDALARGGAGHLAVIEGVLRSPVAARAAAAARALGATGALQAGPALVRSLTHAEVAVREASAVSLGRVGATADDVLALRQAEAAYAWEGTFLRAVRQAIASIQSRLVGADHGQLALAQPAGEVSLAEDASGRVSSPKSGWPALTPCGNPANYHKK